MKKSIACLLIVISPLALSDVRMDFSDGSTMNISDGRVAVGDANNTALFEQGRQGFVIVDHTERYYMNVSETFMEEMAAAIEAQIQQALQQVPPEQRDMFESQLRSMMPDLSAPAAPPTITTTRTGDSASIAGFDCDVVDVTFAVSSPFGDVKSEQTMCIASRGELGMSAADYNALKSAMESLSTLASLGDASAAIPSLDSLDGVPIRTHNREHGDASELTSLSSTVDAAAFAIPEGYREVTLEQMMQQ